MKYENFEEFKNHAKKLQKALTAQLLTKADSPVVKLSAVQEALAQSLDFANLATFKATAFKQNEQIISGLPDNLGPFLLNVEGLAYSEKTMEPASYAIVNQGYSTIDDVLSTHWEKAREHCEFGYDVDAHLPPEFWADCVVTRVYVQCPSINEYGTPYFGDQISAAQRIAERFNLKVLKDVDVIVHDRGDDGGELIFFEVWATQDAINKITSLPEVDRDLNEV